MTTFIIAIALVGVFVCLWRLNKKVDRNKQVVLEYLADLEINK